MENPFRLRWEANSFWRNKLSPGSAARRLVVIGLLWHKRLLWRLIRFTMNNGHSQHANEGLTQYSLAQYSL